MKVKQKKQGRKWKWGEVSLLQTQVISNLTFPFPGVLFQPPTTHHHLFLETTNSYLVRKSSGKRSILHYFIPTSLTSRREPAAI